MPKQGDVHVVYSKPGKVWRIEVTGNKRASGSHATKPPAITQAEGSPPETSPSSWSTGRTGKSASAAATATIRSRREVSPRGWPGRQGASDYQGRTFMADRKIGGITTGGILVIVGIVVALVWSILLGVIIAIIGLVAFGGFARGKWY